MAFRRLIAEPVRKEYNKNHQIDFYEAVNTAYNKAAGLLHKRKDQKEIEAFKREYGTISFQTKFTDNTTVLQELIKLQLISQR